MDWSVVPLKNKCFCMKKLRGISPQANYTDRATAACRRSYCQPLLVEGVAWSAQRIHTAVNLHFLDRCRYFFIQVALKLSSRGWVDPAPKPTTFKKSGRFGNRTRDLWICSQKLWPLDHTGGSKFIGSVNWSNPSGPTKALGSTQPLTEMSTTILPRG
jgi:hypothetical protein